MFKSLILAVVQGITEFLPISSSGHLVILNKLLSLEGDIFFYLVLHLGTIFSLIVFFFKDIARVLKSTEHIKKILIAALVTGGIGFIGNGFFKSLFSDYLRVALFLFINGLILILANRKMGKERKPELNYFDSLLLGVSQAAALIPGISRSGITISTLLFRGIKRQEAFKFSFLAAIPVILFSFIFELGSQQITISDLLVLKYVAAFFLTFLVGYSSLFFLRFLIRKSRLDVFGYYCLGFSLLLWLFR